MDDKEQLRIVIRQMLEHNDVHLEKYQKWARFADENQMGSVSTILNEAGRSSKLAQESLQQALRYLD